HDPSRPRRHRTAEALLGWSYRLLDPAERTALRRLSVFGAGFSLETATPAISGIGGDPDEVAELV
ncbi:MAG: hypothetical protein GWN85_35110, partial [Gemmatimonadetes bacterium]|nr:hypothetical protein [Gemmatimonadota bacterium]NIR40555.1 hypothetical protein [Actinomycetota bacterium]NIS35465.1 hypothetical protein [Actinomycetota bacterium]NIU70134.1 hypothetical protein [Actinomycetota bacterium]NIW32018.1 hypothetical protein [Actinomycetota bacterium]